MRRLLRLTGRLLLGIALGLGWLALLGVLFLVVAEQTGILRGLVLDALRSQAGSLAADLDCSGVSLSWFEPALEIREVTIGKGGDSLLLQRVRVRFSLSRERGLELSSLETRGGRVRISPALINGLKGFSRALGPPESGAAPASGGHARIVVRELSIDWDTRQWGRLPIGRADLDLDIDALRGAELNGRLVPWLAPLEGSLAAVDQGEITLRGRPSGAETFEVQAWASGVPLSTASLPKGTALDALVPYDPRGRLGLTLSARFSLDGSELPRADLRVRINEASCRLSGEQRLHDASLSFDARYAPAAAEESWLPRAWSGRGQLRSAWGEVPLDARFVLGPEAGPGRWAKLWLDEQSFPLEGGLPALLGTSGPARERWNAFQPRGSGALDVALEIPAEWDPALPFFEQARLGLYAQLDGHAGLTYHGWPILPGGRSNQGFPLPIDQIQGELACARDPGALRRLRIALFELDGRHPSGPIVGHGWVQTHAADAPPTLPGHGDVELDLDLSTPTLAVDEVLERALTGLSDPLPPDTSWQPYEPRGGQLAIDTRLLRTVAMPWLAIDLDLRLRGVELRWKDLKLPVHDAQGRLRFRSDGMLQRGLSVVAQGRLDTARSLALELRFQIDPSAPATHAARGLDELVYQRAVIERVSLTGEDQKRLAARFPEIGQGLALATPRGFVDARYERTRQRAGGALASRAEIVPAPDAPVELLLSQFPIPTRDVRGRVLVGLLEQPGKGVVETRTTIAPLIGHWASDVEVAFEASFPERSIRVLGAGVDPAAPTLRGSLAQVLGGSQPGGEADISGIGLAGRVDFQGQIQLGADDAARARTTFRIHLRDDSFSSGQNFRLGALRGTLTLADGILRGERLAARLATTPIELRNAVFQTTGEGFRFETDLSAENVPLDRPHLSSFVDPGTLDALLGDLKWRGQLDVRDGHVTLTGPRQGDSKLVFRGRVIPNDMSITLGLPLAIGSAEARIEELVLEGGQMRAFARVTQLFGRIADRELEQAEMLLTYVEPRLSIEHLGGRFAGGELRPLGQDADRSGTMFSIDLVEPYPFQLALDLRDVRLEELLRGLFASNVASKGRFNCNLRLTGDTEHLLGVQGSGSILVRDSYLWSVPVIRSLLNILRLGSTVTFDSMATNFVVQGGAISMHDIRVASTALQLAGAGTLGFDGTLDFDLEGRLNEIENLEWFSRLISIITDNLVSVTISGDLDRPQVSRHILPFLFRGKERFRALPLPGYAPLPPRF